jgi:hypothetical protein
MKYFTPELFALINSPTGHDDDAEERWERAIEDYNEYLARIETAIPPRLLRFVREQCLHDAELLAFTPAPLFPFPREFYGLELTQDCYTLLTRHQDHLVLLFYADLMAAPSVTKPLESDIFSPAFPTWLYDEVSVVKDGVFSHEVLLSDGFVVRNVFRRFFYFVLPNIHPSPSRPSAGRGSRPPAHTVA